MEGKEDNQIQDSGNLLPPPPPPHTAAPPPPPPPAETTVGGVNFGSDGFKKKRGRPRKYGPDGKPTVALSPMPISASIPLTGDYPSWKHSQGEKSLTSVKRKQKLEFCTPGEQLAYALGPDFTPHVLTVNSGEDVNMKIISFAQQGSKAICVLSANGAISNVTLRQPNSSGGTLTYEGRFDILTLSGAFMSSDNGGAKSMSGGMSVSLAGPDGRVLGGGLAGMLVAAGPIQVILGSFLPGHQHEQQNLKKPRLEPIPAMSPPIMAAMPIFKEATDRAHGDEQNISFTLTSPTNVSRGVGPENNGSLQRSEPKGVNSSTFRVPC
ncbi:putative AT-hook motif nuclear-localized protein [Helianthus annuus]|uniref:AT-hook motif nuclear-localized protein n=1 Tax=Helianthus annuus TaxID=4232 RepID=A0A251SA22_HELAN|nr:AT-hook motif nuclear-localized protein 6 [Helianthus annuus]KAF5765766.1 putative AT-hook motif nuclear-localized protein [Helianthus annuus]KAJ0457063.1 putative AT-hook motif nuclear-localized protein [Helianthus annuus]KAJ0832463.1 putative AT-hook motif nuclear-localized protein [Helianthus annuus]KAJ0845975.1 putative AT-hook motif nuclear-localized protein [Helianthus annuus]